MSDEANDVVVNILPWVGNLTALFLFLSPFKAVLTVKRTGHVGDMNVVPLCFMFFQSQMWAIYGFFIRDISLIPINLIGTILGLFYTMVVYSAIKGPHGTAGGRLRTRVEGIMMLFVTLPGFIACICFFGYDDDTSGGSFLFGLACNIIGVSFYASPLFEIAKMCKAKNAAGISMPLCCCTIMNGTFWAAYGALVDNYFIIIPNSLACALGLFQLTVRRVVGVKDDIMPPVNNDHGDHHHNGHASDEDQHSRDGSDNGDDHHDGGTLEAVTVITPTAIPEVLRAADEKQLHKEQVKQAIVASSSSSTTTSASVPAPLLSPSAQRRSLNVTIRPSPRLEPSVPLNPLDMPTTPPLGPIATPPSGPRTPAPLIAPPPFTADNVPRPRATSTAAATAAALQ